MTNTELPAPTPNDWGPADIGWIIASRPLLRSENVSAYDRALQGLMQEMKPRTRIELFWVKDYFDTMTEILRLRQAKAAIIHLNMSSALQSVLKQLFHDQPIELPGALKASTPGEIAILWHQGNDAQEKIKALLRRYGFYVEDVQAQALVLRLTEIERIDRMLASLERRRDTVLREMELHREFARRLQDRAAAHAEQASLAPA